MEVSKQATSKQLRIMSQNIVHTFSEFLGLFDKSTARQAMTL
jgi:hypothetical protein